jgi:hypothetical protein
LSMRVKASKSAMSWCMRWLPSTAN